MRDRDAYDRNKAKQETNRKKSFIQRWKIRLGNADRITQILLVAFTFGIAVIGFLQWKTFEKQWLTLEKTDDTLKETLRANIESSRAFIFVTNYELHQQQAIWRIMLKWENSGTTPPSEMISRINWKFFPGKMPDSWHFPDFGPNGTEDQPPEDKRAFVGPRTTSYAAPIDIIQPTMDMARTNLGRIYFWGWTEYNDVFEGTERHRTEFCNEMVFTANFVIFPLCDRHNCIDKECKKKK